MTVVNGPSAGQDDLRDPAAHPRPGAALEDVPVRAPGVVLIGEMKGSGYREPPALARRGDGQTIQLSGLLHLVLEAIDGRRTCEQIAVVVSEAFGRTVSADNVRSLVEGQLRPSGLLLLADGSEPQVQKSNPLLALRFKYAVTDPERTRRLTAPFGWLFHPLVVVVVLAALAVVSWWVFLEKGLASATHDAFARPGLLLLVVAVTVLSAGFHEFGHAAAARRGGATPGAMGAGIYLVWPAFYTDVTDSYRLGRGGRVLTDLGGLYFNAIVAVAIGGVWWVTRDDALLLVVATQILQMVRQLMPLVRFDGYHVLADVTGVPDLFQRIRPTLAGLLPWNWRKPENRILKPWARAVVSLWVVAVVPMLLFSLWCMVLALPRVLGTAWASTQAQSAQFVNAWSHGDVLEGLARGVAVLAVVFPVLATGVVLLRVVRSLVRKVWVATQGRPAHRALAALLALALVAGLAYAWWPREGAYRPIQPYEGGTLTQAAATVARPATSQLAVGSYGHVVTGWANGTKRPTAEHPQLALVLVPRDGDTGTKQPPTPGPSTTGTEQPSSWVFPFDQPLAPDPGDNQAVAVNTTDGTAQYSVAFALVWVDDDSPATNTSEAYAFASCQDCAAVSVAFQIVLVTGDNHVAVPQNLAGALNYDCVNCLTYALATQLFVTLDGPLSDAGNAQLTRLWQQIAAYGAHITDVPLSQIRDDLSAYEQQILDLIASDPSQQGATAGADPTASPSASPSASSSASDTASDTGGDTGGDTSGTVGDGATTDPGTGSGESPAPAEGSSDGPSPTEPSASPSDAPSPEPSPSSPSASP